MPTIIPLTQAELKSWLAHELKRVKNFIDVNRFSAKPNSYCLIPDQNGKLSRVLLGVKNHDDFFAFGVLPKALPAGDYKIEASDWTSEQLARAVIGWDLGCYQFSKYKKNPAIKAKLLGKKSKISKAIFWVRDLINTAAEDLKPAQLADEAVELARKFDAGIDVICGEELLTHNFPAIYAVGKGSVNPPVLIDMRWGDPEAPKIVLVGKGICFDSGGLDIKPSGAMRLMKKDMAGAAIALGLASLLMAEKLPINLRVIIAAAENMPSGSSYKVGDVITTRKGTTVEVTNTDAEGRMVLADCLAFASEGKPDLILDFATLTGAARIALGSDLPALFASDDDLADQLIAAANAENEPVWRMPLYQPYNEMLNSKIADLTNCYTGAGGGGAIVAALFLQHFVASSAPWAHFDILGYNAKSRPAKPEGGEATCLMGLFRYFLQRFGK